jgi:hypothetical protein
MTGLEEVRDIALKLCSFDPMRNTPQHIRQLIGGRVNRVSNDFLECLDIDTYRDPFFSTALNDSQQTRSHLNSVWPTKVCERAVAMSALTHPKVRKAFPSQNLAPPDAQELRLFCSDDVPSDAERAGAII